MEVDCSLCSKCDFFYDSAAPGCSFCEAVTAAHLFADNELKIVNLCKAGGVDADYCGNNAVSCVAELLEKNRQLSGQVSDLSRTLSEIKKLATTQMSQSNEA